MYALNHHFLLPFLLAGHAVAQDCIKCTSDWCAAALVPAASMTPRAKSVCESWLAVTTTPVATLTVTVSATTVTVPTTAVTTRTSTLAAAQKMQEKRQLSTNPGVVVPAAVPSPFMAECEDAGAFFSACMCIGASRSTSKAPATTTTVTVTPTGTVAASSSPAAFSEPGTPATPTGFLVVQPNGGPVDNQYLIARNVSQGSSVAVPLLFTPNRNEATVFNIDTTSAILRGYGPSFQGTQMVSGGENAPQSDGNIYNAMFLLPSEYSQNAQLPIPHCTAGGRSQTLDCVEIVPDDTRHILQYCPPRSDWNQPFNTYGFLVLDSTVDPNCTAINMKFQNTT